jgi:hypothetical protein
VARMHKLASGPLTLEQLRASLHRDRRKTERREGGLDRRVFPRERRVGDRRAPQPVGISASAALPDFGDLEIEVADADIEEIEQTLVRDRPVR